MKSALKSYPPSVTVLERYSEEMNDSRHLTLCYVKPAVLPCIASLVTLSLAVQYGLESLLRIKTRTIAHSAIGHHQRNFGFVSELWKDRGFELLL